MFPPSKRVIAKAGESGKPLRADLMPGFQQHFVEKEAEASPEHCRPNGHCGPFGYSSIDDKN